MSRKRSSRPSSSSRTSRTYGSTGAAAGTTNSWPVILRWIVRTASPDSSTTTSLARRPTASTRRPATAAANASGSCVRSVRAHEQRAPTIVAPTRRGRRSRATVSTSGSSGTGDRRLDRLIGLGCGGIRPGQRGHRLPVVADLDVDGQRHVERPAPTPSSSAGRGRAGRSRRAGPRAGARRGPGAGAGPGSPRRRIRSASRIIAILMMSAAVPWIGMLIAIRSPAARRLGLRAWSSGIWRFRPRSVWTRIPGSGRSP